MVGHGGRVRWDKRGLVLIKHESFLPRHGPFWDARSPYRRADRNRKTGGAPTSNEIGGASLTRLRQRWEEVQSTDASSQKGLWPAIAAIRLSGA